MNSATYTDAALHAIESMITKTVCEWVAFSRPFSSNFAGTCAATGFAFYAGDKIRAVGNAQYVCDRHLSTWDFRGLTRDMDARLTGWSSISNWQRTTAPKTDIEIIRKGREVLVMNRHGQVKGFNVQNDGSFKHMGMSGSDKSAKQMIALLRTAHAILVR